MRVGGEGGEDQIDGQVELFRSDGVGTEFTTTPQDAVQCEL